MLRNYVMSIWKFILINTLLFQMLKKRELSDKYYPEKLFLEGYDYSMWSKNKEELTEKKEYVDLSDMPPV